MVKTGLAGHNDDELGIIHDSRFTIYDLPLTLDYALNDGPTHPAISCS